MKNDVKIICKNVFKNNDKRMFKKAYTSIWIELISELEKNSIILLDDRQIILLNVIIICLHIVCFVFS